MQLINHEILGEGYYFLDTHDELTLIDKKYKKIIKKLTKRGYKALSEELLNEHLKCFMKRFIKSLSYITIKTENETISNILRLWYNQGFCHYKTFEAGIVDSGTVTNVKVNICNETINKYPHFSKVEDYGFGYNFEETYIYDEDLEDLYKMLCGVYNYICTEKNMEEVTLNGNKLTESQFEEKKQEYENQKGVQVVEVGNKEYKTRLQD